MVILLKRLSEYIKITINLESRTWRRECLLNWEYITKMMRFKNTRQKEACNIPRQKLLGYAIFKDGLEFHGFFHGIVLFHLSSSTVVRLAQLRRQNSSGRKRKVATCKAWISMSRKKNHHDLEAIFDVWQIWQTSKVSKDFQCLIRLFCFFCVRPEVRLEARPRRSVGAPGPEVRRFSDSVKGFRFQMNF